MTPVIFYSWQSNQPDNVNHGFIEQCLESAIRSLQRNATSFVLPHIVPAGKGTAGTVKTADKIFDKIDGCSAFVADVTPDLSGVTPDPNVLVELGYAAKAIGWERILLVLNTAYGSPETLPSNIQKLPVLTYCAPDTEQDLKAVRKELKRGFENTLESMFSKSFPHCGTLCFLDNTLALEIAKERNEGENDEAQVVLLPLALRGAMHRTLTNIDCYIDFPEGFKPENRRRMALAGDPATESQIVRMLPKKKNPSMADITKEIDFGFRIQKPLLGIKPDLPSPEKATLTVDGQQIRLHIKKLKSHLIQIFPEIYVIIDPSKAEFPATIQCRISTDTGESIGCVTLQRKTTK